MDTTNQQTQAQQKQDENTLVDFTNQSQNQPVQTSPTEDKNNIGGSAQINTSFPQLLKQQVNSGSSPQVPVQIADTNLQMPVQSSSPQQQVNANLPVQPQQPLGSIPHKEVEPMSILSTNNELLLPIEQQVELEPELEAIGVEAITTVPNIPQVAQDVGVTLAKETTLEERKEKLPLKTPLSKEEAEKIVKGQLILKNSSNPMLWLALLILRQLKIFTRQKSVKI